MYDFDVIVIGAGPAGLAASIAAARRGLRVLVADAARPPIDKPCGEGLMPDSQAAARRIGIEIPAALGYLFRGICFCAGGISVTSDFPDGAALGVRRTALHRHLVDCAAAAGVEFEFGAVYTGIDGEKVWLGSRALGVRWIVGPMAGSRACGDGRGWTTAGANRGGLASGNIFASRRGLNLWRCTGAMAASST